MMKVDRFELIISRVKEMNGKYAEIPSLNCKELRRLLKLSQRAYKQIFFARAEAHWRTYHPPDRNEGETWISLTKKVRRLDRSLSRVRQYVDRIRYYLGKARAQNCPAYQHPSSRQVRCRIFEMLDHIKRIRTESHHELFIKYCSCCKLSRKERLKRTQWEMILKA